MADIIELTHAVIRLGIGNDFPVKVQLAGMLNFEKNGHAEETYWEVFTAVAQTLQQSCLKKIVFEHKEIF